ncbi:hypothetical protein B0H11DRAFT_2225808 [Mycena galericulata]|nr:hypothetical protein B0H11DRAFT_2225808 [Mycena galericulata]
MPTSYTTIAVVSQPHIRHTEPAKRAPLGREQLKERAAAREIKQTKIDEALAKWYADTLALADELAAAHKQKAKYFLEMMFQGGAKMVHQQSKQNAYNAFTAEKAAECREPNVALIGGESKDAPALHVEYDAEYRGLTDAQKDKYIEDFRKRREKEVTLRRATPRAKIQDVANITRNMKMLLAGLATRVGVEGFFCIVRNSPDFSMQPQWFFTSRELEAYMPLATRRRWVTTEVGTKIEAFAVAGCNVLNLCRTSKQKADYLKSMIRDLIGEKLGDANAQMQYVWYEEDIVQHYSIVLLGWTFPELKNPSELSTSLPALQELHDALKDGTCFFKKLTPEELAVRKADWLRDVKAGVVERKHRNTRSDKGVKRKAADSDDDDEEAHGGDADNDVDNDAGAGGDAASARPKPKRRRVTAKVPPAPIIEEPPSDTEAAPKEVPAAARKVRKPAAKTSAAIKAVKAPASGKRVTAPAKSKKKAPRDDEVTRAAARATKAKSDAYRAQKEAERAATTATQTPTETEVNDTASRPQPRPLPRPAYAGTKVVSKAFITSDDERNADPNAHEDDDTAPLPRPRRRYGAPITSDDELDDDPDADMEEGNDAGAAIA